MKPRLEKNSSSAAPNQADCRINAEAKWLNDIVGVLRKNKGPLDLAALGSAVNANKPDPLKKMGLSCFLNKHTDKFEVNDDVRLIDSRNGSAEDQMEYTIAEQCKNCLVPECEFA